MEMSGGGTRGHSGSGTGRANRDRDRKTRLSDEDKIEAIQSSANRSTKKRVNYCEGSVESSSINDESSDESSDGDGDSDSDGESEKWSSKKTAAVNKKEIIATQEKCWRYLSQFAEELKPFITERVLKKLTGLTNEPRSKDSKVKQPSVLSSQCTMKDYQIAGLNWLISNYNNGLSCMLGDEMGLGKTLQSISFIAYLYGEMRLKGQSLFIVPLSVLNNWMNEFKKWYPTIRVLRLHSNDLTEQARLKSIIPNYTVVVTTYEVLKSNLGNSIQRIFWRSVFLDEGHRIKSDTSDITTACKKLRTLFRVILTGTPMQNNLREAGALLSFLVPNVFTDLSLFDDAFSITVSSVKKKVKDVDDSEEQAAQKENKGTIDRDLLTKAHYMMRPFILRRVKGEVEQKLPPKLETKIDCPMTRLQSDLVKYLLYKERELLENLESNNGSNETAEVDQSKVRQLVKRGSQLQSLVMQLRKAANHPFLFDGVENVSWNGLATEEVVQASGKLLVLDQLLKKLKEAGHRVVIFSQFTRMLDIISDFLDLRKYRHTRLDGGTNRVMRDVNIKKFNEPNSEYFVFCLSTRAGGEGVNLHTADTVILYDSDWNPQKDLQAMARVHRIGQTKTVHIYRLVTAGSVEEYLVERAQRKLFLDTMVNRGSSANGIAMDKVDNQKTDIQGKESSLGEDGSVEERKSVSRKETASTSGDDVRPSDGNSDDDDDDENEIVPSKAFIALKFGWNSIFVPNQSTDDFTGFDEASLDSIIDRTRGLVDKVTDKEDTNLAEENVTRKLNNKEMVSSDSSAKIFEQQQISVDKFDEKVPLNPVYKFHRHEEIMDRFKDVQLTSHKQRGSLEHSSEALEQVSEDYELVKHRKRREVSSRTIDVFVEGLGVVQMMKERATEMSVKPKQDLNNFTYMRPTGKQVAGRDFDHLDYCQYCLDGGEIVLCDRCPCSFHLKCLLKHERPVDAKPWSCPHHYCHSCMRKGSQTGFIFRCEVCPRAFCEDCLPAKHKLLTYSERMNSVGYRPTTASVYIHCSRDCKKTYRDEFGKDTAVVGSKRKSKEADSEVSDGDIDNLEADNGKAQKKISKRQKQLNDDDRSVESDEYVNASANEPLDSSNQTDVYQRYLESCLLPDVSIRLGRDFQTAASRFHSLIEIPNFVSRWSAIPTTAKALLLHCIRLCNMMMEGLSDTELQETEKNKQSHELSKLYDFANDTEEGIKSLQSMISSDSDHLVANYRGLSPFTPLKTIHRCFFELVKVFCNGKGSDVLAIAKAVGLVSTIPAFTCNCGETIEHTEPKFTYIITAKKQLIDEALAAFFLIPMPQNLMLPVVKSTLAEDFIKRSAEFDNLLYIGRLLQSLGERMVDGNEKYFTSRHLVDRRMTPGINMWTPVYPLGQPASKEMQRIWVKPAIRLLFELKTKDKQWCAPTFELIQQLLGVENKRFARELNKMSAEKLYKIYCGTNFTRPLQPFVPNVSVVNKSPEKGIGISDDDKDEDYQGESSQSDNERVSHNSLANEKRKTANESTKQLTIISMKDSKPLEIEPLEEIPNGIEAKTKEWLFKFVNSYMTLYDAPPVSISPVQQDNFTCVNHFFRLSILRVYSLGSAGKSIHTSLGIRQALQDCEFFYGCINCCLLEVAKLRNSVFYSENPYIAIFSFIEEIEKKTAKLNLNLKSDAQLIVNLIDVVVNNLNKVAGVYRKFITVDASLNLNESLVLQFMTDLFNSGSAKFVALVTIRNSIVSSASMASGDHSFDLETIRDTMLSVCFTYTYWKVLLGKGRMYFNENIMSGNDQNSATVSNIPTNKSVSSVNQPPQALQNPTGAEPRETANASATQPPLVTANMVPRLDSATTGLQLEKYRQIRSECLVLFKKSTELHSTSSFLSRSVQNASKDLQYLSTADIKCFEICGKVLQLSTAKLVVAKECYQKVILSKTMNQFEAAVQQTLNLTANPTEIMSAFSLISGIIAEIKEKKTKIMSQTQQIVAFRNKFTSLSTISTTLTSDNVLQQPSNKSHEANKRFSQQGTKSVGNTNNLSTNSSNINSTNTMNAVSSISINPDSNSKANTNTNSNSDLRNTDPTKSVPEIIDLTLTEPVVVSKASEENRTSVTISSVAEAPTKQNDVANDSSDASLLRVPPPVKEVSATSRSAITSGPGVSPPAGRRVILKKPEPKANSETPRKSTGSTVESTKDHVSSSAQSSGSNNKRKRDDSPVKGRKIDTNTTEKHWYWDEE